MSCRVVVAMPTVDALLILWAQALVAEQEICREGASVFVKDFDNPKTM